MTDTIDPMAEIRASFFIECEELLEELQDGLQAMEDGSDDSETINVVFRAVHSIKGGAGAFGLEKLVRFAHRLESVLDEIRTGQTIPDETSLKVLFRCADHLSDLVRTSRDGVDLPQVDSKRLLGTLAELLKQKPTSDPQSFADKAIEFRPTALSLNFEFGDDAETTNPAPCSRSISGDKRYLITFKPETELFEKGNEPFLILRALDEIGPCTITCDASSVPGLAELAPETSYLSWTIELFSNVNEAEIASAFEFVQGLCALEIAVVEDERPPPQFEVAKTSVHMRNLEYLTSPDPIDLSRQDAEPSSLDRPPTAQAQDLKDAVTTSGALQNSLSSSSAATAAKAVVRVELDRIETLVNLVGELVINQSMLTQSLESSGLSPHSDAMSGLEEFQRLTRDIQESVMMIRAQPVKSLFQRMSRIVREASAAVDKEVKLITEGECTEVDKTIIERLADPLTHMIRNAVDHGLETPKERLAAGKPVQGLVKLSAAHKSGRVIIEVSDDGGGINRAKVLQVAVDKGLIATDADLSDNEIDNLLFLPGFSTAEEVSDLSGRGVGMDVVREAIQTLGGRITIASSPGVGTVFSISLPLTLAVLDGMVFQVAEETLVLPLNTVIETLTLTNKSVETIHPGAKVVRVRNGFVPLYDLGYELGYRAPANDYDGSVVLLIAHDDDGQAALLIDSIQDQRQVVIKGLSNSIYRAPGIAAATILGAGQIALILDTSDIISSVTGTNTFSRTETLAGLSA